MITEHLKEKKKMNKEQLEEILEHLLRLLKEKKKMNKEQLEEILEQKEKNNG